MTMKGSSVARQLLLGLAVWGLCLSACGSAPRADPPAGGPGSTFTVGFGQRPFRLHLPKSYESATKIPLVVLLHGYTSSAAKAESYFKLTAESDRRGFLYAMPDGTRDARGDRFWNATDACCNFFGSGVDDSGYLRGLIDDLKSRYPVDPGRVFVVGHSNGGFMAHRLACEHAAAITAIVSFAGAAPNDPARCTPSRPVSVLQIHGTADSTIRFEGGSNAGRPYPSVPATVDLWRRLNGCADQAGSPGEPIDLESTLPGAETTVTSYPTSCREGRRVELWSISEGTHVPQLTDGFGSALSDFLLAHR